MKGLGPELGRHAPEDPFPVYERLVTADPMPWIDYYRRWAVLGYEAARQVLLDDSFLTDDVYWHILPRLAKSSGRDFGGVNDLLKCTAFYLDPPAHGPARRLIAKMLARRPASELRGAAEALAARLLKTARAQGGFDLVRDYASRIPAGIVAQILGMPEEDTTEVIRNATTFVELFDVFLPLRAYQRINDASRAMVDYFADLVRERRRAPREDGISYMLRMAADQPGFSDRDIAGFCAFVFIAGEESTSSFISGGAATLFQSPDLVAALRADPAKIASASDDILRHQSPVQGVGRVATADRVVAGKTVAAGTNLTIYLASANRDPSVYPGGGCPVFHRDGPPHIAFGLGAHSCLGNSLARMEGAVAFSALLGQPELRLDLAHAVWAQRRLFRGLTTLPVELW